MTDEIKGSGGGGGKSGGGSEVKDNQFSNVNAKLMVAYSSGQTDGLINGRKSVFLDETQLDADDGSENFKGVTFNQRTGLIAQQPVDGFEQARNTVSVSTQIQNGTPVIRTVSSIDVNAVRLIITLPSLQKVTEKGNIEAASVSLTFQVRDPAAGVWEDRGTKTITGKSSGAFQRQFKVDMPSAVTGAWDWRVIRNTADSTSNRLNNDTTIQAAVELFYGQQTYPDTAYVALEVNTADFGNSIPSLAFEVSGVRVRVPANYTDIGGIPAYTGVWDGSWQYMSTENPVWHIYNLITDDEIGLGLPETFVDRYNFYEAARYCDAVNASGVFVGVDDGNGGVRKRFTINTQITGQKDGLGMLQDIASSMRSIIYFGAGAVVLKQDAPRSVSKIVTNENVKDGLFAYSTTQAKDRITVAKVGYNDPEDFFKLKYVRFPEQTDWASDTNIARYGRNEIEVAKFGCASEAEAFSYAKWIVFTSCSETKTLTFTGGPEFMLSRPGDVIEVADRRLAGAASLDQRMGGRIKSATINTVELDYPVELTSGETYTITVVGTDGVTLETRDITTTAGTDITTITVDSDFSTIPVTQHTWLIGGTDIAPQKFSVINVERQEGLNVEIFAVQYDETKFSSVEQNVEIVDKPFTRIDMTGILPPTNLNFQMVPRVDTVAGVKNSLIVRWTASISEYATRYQVLWRRESDTWTQVAPTDINEIVIPDVTEGYYEVQVVSINPLGQTSIPVTGDVTVQLDGTIEWDGSTLTILAPTITTGQVFTSKDLTVEWTRASGNDIPGIVFNRYKVTFGSSGSNIFRTVYTEDTNFTYYHDDQVVDQGINPARNITVRVYEQDTFLNESAEAVKAFNNTKPDKPAFQLVPGFGTVVVNITPATDPDIAGYYVFRSTDPTFSASTANIVHDGPDPSFVDSLLADNTTYYYRAAAYDLFSTGISTLRISDIQSQTTLTAVGAVTNYDFEGLEFSVAGSTVSFTASTVYTNVNDVVSTTSLSAGSESYSSGTLYFYYDPDLESIEANTNLVTAYQGGEKRRVVATYDGTTLREGTNKPIIDGADILAQTIGATQVVSSNLITNTAQIANGIIETANIKAGAITNAKIGTAEIDTLSLANGSVTEVTISGSGSSVSTSVNGGSGSFGSLNTTIFGFHLVPSPTGLTGPFQSQIISAVEISKNTTTSVRIEGTCKLLKDGVVIDEVDTSFDTTGLFITPNYTFSFLGVAGSTYQLNLNAKFTLLQSGNVTFSVANRSGLGITVLR